MKDTFKKLMIIASVLASVSATASASLVAHWKLDETSGTTASDSSGNGHDGALSDGCSFDDKSVHGVIGNALAFDRAKDHLNADSVDLPTDRFTIALWFNPDSTLGSNHREMHFVYWARGDRPYIAFNEGGDGRIGLYLNLKDGEFGQILTKTNVWRASTWHHVAVTFDETEFGIYIDGQIENTGHHLGSHGGAQSVLFGMKADNTCSFDGKLDDIRIYSHALTPDEVAQLLGSPAVPFLVGAVQEAQTILQDQGPQKAISFIEKKIVQWGELQDNNPEGFGSRCKELSLDLRFLLAKAKEAAGFPKDDVDETYRSAVEPGMLPFSNSGAALLWLHEKLSRDEYGDVGRSLIRGDRDYLRVVAERAGAMIAERESEAATRFLQDSLAVYDDWRKEYPDDDVLARDSLPAVYYELARARDAMGAVKEDVADAYSKTFSPSRRKHLSEQTAALIWLSENGAADKYLTQIKLLAQSGDAKASFERVVENVCEYFESKKDWASFEWFLDTLFSVERYPSAWVVFVESCVGDETSRWAKRYLEYVDSKPRLKFSRDRIAARKYVDNKDFKKAADLYRDILERCGPEDDRAVFTWELCECLFHGSADGQIVPTLESFIADYNETYGDLVKEAMLLKGVAHVQLGEPDKALESFSAVMNAYPETKNMPQVNFYVSYCYMLQGKSEAAEKAFDKVIRDYPGSLHASKASICLTHIKDMPEQIRVGSN